VMGWGEHVCSKLVYKRKTILTKGSAEEKIKEERGESDWGGQDTVHIRVE